MYGPDSYKLKLKVSTDGGNTWSTLNTHNGDQGNTWHKVSGTLPPQYETATTMFRFTARSGNGVYSDIGLDNFKLLTNSPHSVHKNGNASSEESSIALQSPTLTCYPNPNQGRLHVDFESPTEGNTRISVMDLTGRVLLSLDKDCFSGVNQFQLDLSQLPNGTYLLRANQQGKSYHQTLILSR